MDKFIVRKPRDKRQRKPCSSPRKRLKQSTIKDLAGVVVLEEIRKQKRRLESRNQDKEIIMSDLKKLSKKQPGIDILKETQIGKPIKKLTRHPDKEISKLASSIHMDWLNHIIHIKKRKSIEVESDCTTVKTRSKAKEMLSEHFSHQGGEKVDEIEGEVFTICGKLLSKRYKRTIRKIWFKLKEENVKQEILLGNISPKMFVQNLAM